MNATARIILMIVIGTSLCAACQQADTPSAPEPTATLQPTEAPALNRNTEEIAVYSALLDHEFTGDISQFLIVDQTRLPSPGLVDEQLGDFQEQNPLDQGLLTNFLELNQQPSALNPDMDLGLEYQLMTQEEIDELAPLDKESGWKLLDEKYPKALGFIYLSRVGFNTDLNQALVYYERYYYDQPIMGGYLFLTRQDGQWVVETGYEWMT